MHLFELSTHISIQILLSPITTQSHILRHWRNIAMENIVEKEENDGYQLFLLFPQYFILFLTQFY